MSRAALAKVHIAKKALGLDDETYRAMLERITGRTSSKDCTEGQLGQVLDEMKAKGWKPAFRVVSSNSGAAGRRGAPASNAVAKKARALWISLHQLGAVRDPSESALEAFGARQLKVAKLQWVNESHGFRLIEALKAMAERAGWRQDVAGIKPSHVVLILKRRLFVAQEVRLQGFDPARLDEADLVATFSLAELDERIAENARHIQAHLVAGEPG